MEFDMVADMEVDMVADMEVDKVADKVADKKKQKKWSTWFWTPKREQNSVNDRGWGTGVTEENSSKTAIAKAYHKIDYVWRSTPHDITKYHNQPQNTFTYMF